MVEMPCKEKQYMLMLFGLFQPLRLWVKGLTAIGYLSDTQREARQPCFLPYDNPCLLLNQGPLTHIVTFSGPIKPTLPLSSGKKRMSFFLPPN